MCYSAICKHNWLEELTCHMDRCELTKEKCRGIAKEAGNIKNFRNNYKYSYRKSREKGWILEFFPK